MADLFTPCTLKGVTLRKRIVASAMRQYQARDGVLPVPCAHWLKGFGQ